MKQSRRFTLDSQSSEHGLSGSDSLNDYETTRDTMTLGREERTEFLTSQIYIKRQFDSRKRRSSQQQQEIESVTQNIQMIQQDISNMVEMNATKTDTNNETQMNLDPEATQLRLKYQEMRKSLKLPQNMAKIGSNLTLKKSQTQKINPDIQR